MSREIKFRAWQDNQMLQMPLSGNYALSRFIGFLYEDAPIMQCTGLKDKNGKEIYEGDVCTFLNPYNHNDYKRVVRYCNLFACFGLFTDMETIYDYESDWVKIVNIEILGNIYENPDLL